MCYFSKRGVVLPCHRPVSCRGVRGIVREMAPVTQDDQSMSALSNHQWSLPADIKRWVSLFYRCLSHTEMFISVRLGLGLGLGLGIVLVRLGLGFGLGLGIVKLRSSEV